MQNLPIELQNIIFNYAEITNKTSREILIFDPDNINPRSSIEKKWRELLLQYPQFLNIFELLKKLTYDRKLFTYGSELFTTNLRYDVKINKFTDPNLVAYFNDIIEHTLPDNISVKMDAATTDIDINKIVNNNYNFYDKLINSNKVAVYVDGKIEIIIINDVLFEIDLVPFQDNLFANWLNRQMKFMKCTEFYLDFAKIDDKYLASISLPPRVNTLYCRNFYELDTIPINFFTNITTLKLIDLFYDLEDGNENGNENLSVKMDNILEILKNTKITKIIIENKILTDIIVNNRKEDERFFGNYDDTRIINQHEIDYLDEHLNNIGFDLIYTFFENEK